MHLLRFALALALTASLARADGLRVEAVELTGPSTDQRVEVVVSWQQAFRDERNHDAVWLVLRAAGELPTALVPLADSGHAAAGEVAGEVLVAEDGTGVFVQLADAYRGDVRWTLTLVPRVELDAAPEVWAVEMVYIPAGAFELGDDHPDARALGSFFEADGEGGARGPYRVESEAELALGTAPGELTHDMGERAKYSGDGEGPLPAAFPKGTRAFYVMKHELRQGEYARFLNALPEAWHARRRPDLTPPETQDRATCSIELGDDSFVATAPLRPCNFVTWDDSCAYFDFLGLRPLTELEFEKAARGPARPLPFDFPWGTASIDEVARRVNERRDVGPAPIGSLEGADRVTFAVSYYRVMDLAGSIWERVISAGHPAGRAFAGTHGDGRLDPQTGDATNADWPSGDRSAPGIGFRGGAEYFTEPSPTNPFSAVGVRTYAAYDGAHRYKTYGARGVRTAPGP